MLVASQGPGEFESAGHGEAAVLLGLSNLIVVDHVLQARVIFQKDGLHVVALLSEILHHDREYFLEVVLSQVDGLEPDELPALDQTQYVFVVDFAVDGLQYL